MACLQLDPLSDSFSSDFVFYLYSVLYTLDKSTDVITPMSCRTADATAASARSEIIYLSHAISNAEIFRRYPALALENSGVTWVGKLLPGSFITV